MYYCSSCNFEEVEFLDDICSSCETQAFMNEEIECSVCTGIATRFVVSTYLCDVCEIEDEL